jgi:hypothetical protein
MSDSVHDRIATVLEKLHAVQPELTKELVDLLASVDVADIRKLFGAKEAATEISSPAASTPSPSPPPPAPAADESIGPRSPDRFPNWPGNRTTGDSAWSA